MATTILNQTETLQLLCKSAGKWGMYISIYSISYEGELLHEEELLNGFEKAAPYLRWPEHSQIIIDGVGYLLFDTEAEMLIHYDQTVGDDGPTKLNSYAGPAIVFAVTCNPEGQLLNENT